MDISNFVSSNHKNCRIESVVADIHKVEPCRVGIDEAGRGPVLGPMVYGICFSPLACDEDLKKMGLADSKTLDEEKRDTAFAAINSTPESIGWAVDILSPNYISNCMLRRSKYNLNALSHDTAISLLKRIIENKVNVKEVYVDTVGDPGKYQDNLSQIFPNISITVAKKADSTYPIVSAASICAKVSRDAAVKNWRFPEGIEAVDYGSGYPGDEKTKKFLINHTDSIFGFPSFVRFSWQTSSKILEEKAAVVRWEDDEDEDDPKQKKLSFSVPPRPTATRHRYFVERRLEVVQQL